MTPEEEAEFYTDEKLTSLSGSEVLDVLECHIADPNSDDSSTIRAYDTIYERADSELRRRLQ